MKGRTEVYFQNVTVHVPVGRVDESFAGSAKLRNKLRDEDDANVMARGEYLFACVQGAKMTRCLVAKGKWASCKGKLIKLDGVE
jgi:hypothetical protein